MPTPVEVRAADGGLLALPEPHDPVASIYLRPDGAWVYSSCSPPPRRPHRRRARAQLAKVGVADAASLIERRAGRQFRLGIRTVELVPLASAD